MKRLLAFLAILILLLLPALALANDMSDRIQIQGDVKVMADEIVAGDAVAILGDVTVDGKVMGDVVAVMGDVTVNGEVMGDVITIGGHVIRSDTSKIYGKVTQIGVGDGIGRVISRFTTYGPHSFNISFGKYRFPSIFTFARFLGTVALAALCIILFPNSVKTATRDVDIQTGRKFLIGLVILLLTPVVIGLMVITLLGIPLVPVAILLLAAAAFFGYISVSVFLGQKLKDHFHIKPSIFIEYILGAVLLRLLQLVPFVGTLISLTVMLYSIGITADTRFGTKSSA